MDFKEGNKILGGIERFINKIIHKIAFARGFVCVVPHLFTSGKSYMSSYRRSSYSKNTFFHDLSKTLP